MVLWCHLLFLVLLFNHQIENFILKKLIKNELHCRKKAMFSGFMLTLCRLYLVEVCTGQISQTGAGSVCIATILARARPGLKEKLKLRSALLKINSRGLRKESHCSLLLYYYLSFPQAQRVQGAENKKSTLLIFLRAHF